jgi:hypothetical protein
MDKFAKFARLEAHDASQFYNEVGQELGGQVLVQVVNHIASATNRSIRISVLRHVVRLLDGNVGLIEGLGNFLNGSIDVMTRRDGTRCALLYGANGNVQSELWRDARTAQEAGVTMKPNEETSEKRSRKKGVESEVSTADEDEGEGDMQVDDTGTECIVPDAPASSFDGVAKLPALAAHKRDDESGDKPSYSTDTDEPSELAPAPKREGRKRLNSSDRVDEDEKPARKRGHDEALGGRKTSDTADEEESLKTAPADHVEEQDDDDLYGDWADDVSPEVARDDEEHPEVDAPEAGDEVAPARAKSGDDVQPPKVAPARANRKQAKQVESAASSKDDESHVTESDEESLAGPDGIMQQTVMDAIFSRLDTDDVTVKPARIFLVLRNGRATKTSHTNVLSLDEKRTARPEGTIIVALSSVATNIFEQLDAEIESESYTIGVAINTYEATVDTSRPPHEVCNKTTVCFSRLGRFEDLAKEQISNLHRACQEGGVNAHQVPIDFKELWDATSVDLPNEYRDDTVG